MMLIKILVGIGVLLIIAAMAILSHILNDLEKINKSIDEDIKKLNEDEISNN